jgi:hypothetical protein
VNGLAVDMTVMIHLRSDATTRVTLHPDEDRVVLGLRDPNRPGELMLFLDRAALGYLHTLTGSALAELTDQAAAMVAATDMAADPAA